MKKYYALAIITVFFLTLTGFITILKAAEIVYMEGTVQVKPAGSEDWQNAQQGMKVNIGDTIRTARRSKADIALDVEKKNTLRIDPKTLLVLDSISAGEIDRVDLSRGKVYSNLESLKQGMVFEVSTPSAVAGARGTSYSVYTERDEDEIQSYKDDVFLKAFDADKNMITELTLPEGFKTFVERFEGPTALIQVSLREFARWDSVATDLTSHSEGRERGREERERGETGAKSTEENTGEVDDQQSIAGELDSAKDQVEEMNIEELLGEREPGHSS